MLRRKYLLLIIAMLCLSSVSFGAEEILATPAMTMATTANEKVATTTVINYPEKDSAFEVPDVTIKASDISSINEIEKDHIEIDAPKIEKESPIVQKNFVFSFITETKEVPGISSIRPAAAQGVNSIYAMIGSNGVNIKYLYGKSTESDKYFLEFEHDQRYLGSGGLNYAMTRAEGSLSTVIFENKTDLDAEYKTFASDSPLGSSRKIQKDQLKVSADTILPFSSRYSIISHAHIAPYFQKVIASDTQGFDWEISARSKLLWEEDEPYVYRIKLGHLGFADRGLNILSPGVYFERALSSENKVSLGLDLPFYWDSGHSYSQISLTAQLSHELSEASSVWFKLHHGLGLPDTSELVMSDPFVNVLGRIKPEEYVFWAEIGYSARYSDQTEISCQLQSKTIVDPLILFDSNADGLPDYSNGSDMNVIVLKGDISKALNEETRIAAHSDLVLSARTIAGGGRVPYTPFLKGWIGVDHELEKTLIWQNRLNFCTEQYVAPTSGSIAGYMNVETKLKKEFSRTFEGYFALRGFSLQSYSLYDNIPAEVFSVSAGFSMNF